MHKKFTLTAFMALGILSAPLSGPAHAQQPTDQNDWQFTLGAGAVYAPKYEGSDDFEVKAIPVANADYKDGLFFANLRDGIGSYPLRGENYKIGAAIGYQFGRDESDDRDNLRGMGDVDESAVANILASYDLGQIAQISGKVSTAISGDYGTTVDVKIGSRYPVTDKIILSGSVGTQWADGEHMSNRFSVSSAQSTRSGYTQYDAGSGIKSVGATIGATYRVTERWSTNLTLHGHQLVGDAADSPVVKDEFVPAAFLTTTYKF